MASPTVQRWLDLGERTLATYGQAFCGLLLADSTHMLALGAVRAAAIAALPAALAAVKSAFALGFSSSGTASLVPVGKDAPPPSMVNADAAAADAPGGAPA